MRRGKGPCSKPGSCGGQDGGGDRLCGLLSFARQQAADLIHTNTIVTPEGGLAARRLGLPHVWHLREVVGPTGPIRLAREDASFGEYMRRHASVVVANSYITAAAVRDWMPSELLRIVPNGIDLARFQPRSGYSVTGRPLVVAMVASLTSRWKKHALFIEAASKVDQSLPLEFRIYGHTGSAHSTTEDHYAAQLRRLANDAGLADRLRWPGYLADPVEIMDQIDILVHPADGESFGRVIVEAMAAGLPVVGVRGGGVGEIVQDQVTGILAEPNRADHLAAAVERLACDESLRRTMGQAGRRRADENYSLAACTAGMLEMYQLAMQRPLAV